MAIPWQSTRNHNAISAFFKAHQERRNINPARAWQFYDLYRRGILHPQSSGQICCCIGTMSAAISNYLALISKVVHEIYTPLQVIRQSGR
jgi:hypothetical protein